MNGTINTLTDKGFGFIKSEDFARNIFFHSNELLDVLFDDLREGDDISFGFEVGPKGIAAVKVQRGSDTEELNLQKYDAWQQNNFGSWVIEKRNGLLEISPQLHLDGLIFPDNSKQPNDLNVSPSTNRWKRLLKQLEELINNIEGNEYEFQSFFEENPEFILGDDFNRFIPQATIVKDGNIRWKADFILIPKDQLYFSKIIELKMPNSKISLRTKSGHNNYSNNLYKAINQLKDYYKAFESENTKLQFKKKYNADIFMPDLQLLFGRRNLITNNQEFLAFQKAQNVQIKDWDTYLNELRRQFK